MDLPPEPGATRDFAGCVEQPLLSMLRLLLLLLLRAIDQKQRGLNMSSSIYTGFPKQVLRNIVRVPERQAKYLVR